MYGDGHVKGSKKQNALKQEEAKGAEPPSMSSTFIIAEKAVSHNCEV
jgi:hypothetical protein